MPRVPARAPPRPAWRAPTGPFDSRLPRLRARNGRTWPIKASAPRTRAPRRPAARLPGMEGGHLGRALQLRACSDTTVASASLPVIEIKGASPQHAARAAPGREQGPGDRAGGAGGPPPTIRR